MVKFGINGGLVYHRKSLHRLPGLEAMRPGSVLAGRRVLLCISLNPLIISLVPLRQPRQPSSKPRVADPCTRYQPFFAPFWPRGTAPRSVEGPSRPVVPQKTNKESVRAIANLVVQYFTSVKNNLRRSFSTRQNRKCMEEANSTYRR